MPRSPFFLQYAFGARDRIAQTGVDTGGGIEGPSKCFKQCLNFVVVVFTVHDATMQIHAGVDGNAFE